MPLADWPERLSPGGAAAWLMQRRRRANISGGSAAVRLKALAWPDDPNGSPVGAGPPVTISDQARGIIDQASDWRER
jgi:hypothetical protein